MVPPLGWAQVRCRRHQGLTAVGEGDRGVSWPVLDRDRPADRKGQGCYTSLLTAGVEVLERGQLSWRIVGQVGDS